MRWVSRKYIETLYNNIKEETQMDIKTREELIEGFDKMEEMVKELRSMSFYAPPKPKVEPQAGDVWMYSADCVFIHQVEILSKKLTYTYRSGIKGSNPIEVVISQGTRIFSLSEYLKGKDNG